MATGPGDLELATASGDAPAERRMEPVRWGVLSTAVIGLTRVIPAMQAAGSCEVVALASRDLGRARAAASDLGIDTAHGSYEALLEDPSVEAIYNPLPNHLHVEWSLRALEAGKHVLCEKPLGLNAAECLPLIEARDRTGLEIEEAFMVRNHPQWLKAREIVRSGRIGELRAVQAIYAYDNPDPDNIRNRVETGGGGIYDIGSYCATIARFLFEAEPRRVVALVERDPGFGTDRLSSAILDFEQGQATLTVATRTARYSQVQILGTTGWIRPGVPFTQPDPFACWLDVGANEYPGPLPVETIRLEPLNQYTLQGERFSRLVRGEPAERWPLDNAIANMRVIDALYASAERGGWIDVTG